MSYPSHLTAHAEPSAAAYHVYCPACARWSGGAVAEAMGLGVWLVRCPACGSAAPGSFSPAQAVPGGVYAGRAVSSLASEDERDFLGYVLTASPPTERGLRLAILWQLGWLSAARQRVLAGPDLARLRARLAREQRAARQAARQAQADPAREAAREVSARQQASWIRQMRAEQERLDASKPNRGPKREPWFHQYQRPPAGPPPTDAPPKNGGRREKTNSSRSVSEPAERLPWAVVLGLDGPVSGEQIRRAYRRLSKRAHPDVGGSKEQMQRLNQAYEQAQKWWAGHRR